jgi:hypothetical protein
MKTAIIILSDPKSGSEDALGRVFNALALASECKQKGDEVAVVFNGAGTRWPAELTMPFAMSCKAPHTVVRRFSGRWKESRLAEFRL